MTARLKVGDVIDVAEADYMYGTGRLIMQVTKIGQVVQINGADWVDLEGHDLRPDGSRASDRVRHAVVRRTGLRLRAWSPEAKP
jgi:hypothetical protein